MLLFAVGEELRQRLAVDARRGHVAAQAVDGERAGGEADALAQLGHAPGVGEALKHRCTSTAPPAAVIASRAPRAERVRPDGERVATRRPSPRHLTQPALVHQAACAQLVGSDRRAGGEDAELSDVEDGVLGARDGPEAALRQPALQRHLAALVPRRAVAARARPPPLVPATGRLAVAGARPAPDALAPARRSGRRMQMTEVHAVSPPSRPGARPWRACRARPGSPSG